MKQTHVSHLPSYLFICGQVPSAPISTPVGNAANATLPYVPARWCYFLFARFAAGGPCGVEDGWIPSPAQPSAVHGRPGQAQGSHTDRLPLSRPHRQDLLRGWPWRVERACLSIFVCVGGTQTAASSQALRHDSNSNSNQRAVITVPPSPHGLVARSFVREPDGMPCRWRGWT
jgi:hypothetical protein